MASKEVDKVIREREGYNQLSSEQKVEYYLEWGRMYLEKGMYERGFKAVKDAYEFSKKNNVQLGENIIEKAVWDLELVINQARERKDVMSMADAGELKTNWRILKQYKKTEQLESRMKGTESEYETKKLESKVNKSVAASVLSISSLILALFFLSNNFTGYSIADMPISTYNSLGVLFFVVGLVFALSYMRNKK